VGDKLYALTHRVLSERSLDTGEQTDGLVVPSASSGGLTYADGVIVGSGYSVFGVDVEEGYRVWTSPELNGNLTVPVVTDGVAVVGVEHTGNVYGVDIETGELRWAVETSAVEVPLAAAADGVAYAVDLGGFLYAIDVASGSVRWRRRLDTHSSDGAPVVADGRVYVGDSDGTLYAFDAETGEPRWRRTLAESSIYAPAVGDGTLYVTDGDGGVHALSVNDGSTEWSASTAGWFESPSHVDDDISPVLAGDTLYVAGDHAVHAFAVDEEPGLLGSRRRWEVRVRGIESLLVAGPRVYAVSGLRTIAALGPTRQ
jgi:outer membrane protein assembly factor BamB